MLVPLMMTLKSIPSHIKLFWIYLHVIITGKQPISNNIQQIQKAENLKTLNSESKLDPHYLMFQSNAAICFRTVRTFNS